MILAVDGGNSKTDVAILADDGRLLGAVRGPTASHQQVGLAVGMDRLAGMVATAVARSGPEGTSGATVGVFGLAGADTPADGRRLRGALTARGLADDVLVVNDAFPPIRAGTDRGWGIALICGSGVNAAGIAPGGRTARLAALGDIAGDWGGGGDIGLAAIGAAVRGRDGRGPRTSLETLVPAYFGLRRPVDVTRRLEVRTLDMDRRYELSPVVFQAARAGDAVARSIIDRQADELVAMGRAMIRRLHVARLDPVVVLAGGVFAARDAVLEDRVEDGIRRIARHATVVRLDAPPILGVALLGLDRLLASDPGAHAAAVETARATLGTWRPDD